MKHVEPLLHKLAAAKWRQLIWLEGDYAWCAEQVKAIYACLAECKQQTTAVIWLQAQSQAIQPPSLPEGIQLVAAAKNRNFLGSEQDLLVIDAFSGVHPDSLGALGGTVKAGGLVLLITPPNWPQAPCPDYVRATSWPYQASNLSQHFLSRVAQILQREAVPKISAAAGVQGNWQVEVQQHYCEPTTFLYGAASQEQAELVSSLLAWYLAGGQAPRVITAPRGRGKSGALGLVVRELLNQQPSLKILITAPAAATCQAIFARFVDCGFTKEQVEFCAPDALLEVQPKADLLLVDEAAALPVPILQQLLALYPHSIFATTQQGYEGSGRGFTLRFMQYLQQHFPAWQELKLTMPLRWAAHCPLENLLNQMLLLDADLQDPNPHNCNWHFSWLTQAELAADEELLRQAFGLLVLAHYRTQPDNLRLLLDAPQVRLAAVWQDNLLVGLAWVQGEGGFPQNLAEEIFLGKRRPQGNLLAQSLAFHAGYPQAATAKWWRIQRILIHPYVQGQGLGSQLLNFVQQAAAQEPDVDFLGASFGATTQLVKFWLEAGFQPVRVGITQDQASGEYTVQLAKALNAKALVLQQQLSSSLVTSLEDLLPLQLRKLDAALVVQLLAKLPLHNLVLDEQIDKEIYAFAYGHRPLAVSRRALKHWLYLQAQAPKNSKLNLVAWVRLLLQLWPEDKLQDFLQLKGKKALDVWLRTQVRETL